MKKKRPWWHRVLLYAGSTLVFYLAVCAYLANLYLHPLRTVPEMPTGLQDVWIDGSSPAWVTSKKFSPTAFVFAHGYGGDRGHWANLVRELKKRGYDSVVPAMPGQDASKLPQVGFGPLEAEVVRDSAAWAREHGAKRIVLVGVSMGGAASWLATQLDPSVDAVVTEGAYARFGSAMTHWLDSAVPGGSVTLRPVVWIATWRSGIEPDKIRPEEAAAKWKKPALVIQADKDTLILREHAERLSKAANCELWVVPKAVHANCYWAAPEEYVARLVRIAAGTTRGRPLPVNSRN